MPRSPHLSDPLQCPSFGPGQSIGKDPRESPDDRMNRPDEQSGDSTVPLTARHIMITGFVTVQAGDAPERAATPALVLGPAGSPEWLIGPDGPGAILVIPPSTTVVGLLDDSVVLDLLIDGLPGV